MNKAEEKNTISFEGFQGFTVIPNHVFERITDSRALGVICYLFHHAPNWEIRLEHIQAHFDFKKYACGNVFKILEDAGYAKLIPVKNDKGKMVGRRWVLSFHPKAQKTRRRKKPDVVNSRRSDSSTVEKTAQLTSSNDLTSINKKTNSNLSPSMRAHAENKIQGEIQEKNEISLHPESHLQKEEIAEAVDVATLNFQWVKKSLSNSAWLNRWKTKYTLDQIEIMAEQCAAHHISKLFQEAHSESLALSSLQNKLSKSTGIREAGLLHSWIQKEPQFNKNRSRNERNTNPHKQPRDIKYYRDWSNTVAGMAEEYAERKRQRNEAIERAYAQNAATAS